jgi:hypothetical protein
MSKVDATNFRFTKWNYLHTMKLKLETAMQMSRTDINIIQSDASVNQLLNLQNPNIKAYRWWIPNYNTKRNWQAMSLTDFFCLITLPSILGQPHRSNLSFWIRVADQHPSHYATPSSILPHNH